MDMLVSIDTATDNIILTAYQDASSVCRQIQSGFYSTTLLTPQNTKTCMFTATNSNLTFNISSLNAGNDVLGDGTGTGDDRLVDLFCIHQF